MKLKFTIILSIALALGLVIGWIDSNPRWDDAGISAAAVILATTPLGAAMPSRAWLWALTVGGCILLLNVILNNNYGAILALVIAFLGAYTGVIIRRAISLY